MEKYRQFGDGGTGVNPFVPVWSHHKSLVVVRALKVLILFPIAVLRLALLAVAVAWLGLAELVCAPIPLGVLRYPLYRLLSSVGCAVALFALGLLMPGDALADHRRLKIASPKAGGGRAFDAGHGTLVLANQQGLTDVLYLGLRLCPTFVFLAGNGVPVRCSLLSALRRAGSRRPAPPLEQGAPLAEIADWAQAGRHGPVAIFAEGARTNGSCILAWKPETFAGPPPFERPAGTALVGIEYSKTGAYTPHHTVGTAFRHVLWLCLQPWHTVQAVWLPAPSVATAIKGKTLTEQTALLRTVLTRMIPGAVEVEVSCSKHLDFMAYWDASQRKRYTQHQKKVA